MARRAWGRISAKFDIREEETAIGGTPGISVLSHLLEMVIDLSAGVNDGQIDRAYSDVLTLSTTPTTFDVINTTILSKLNGQAISLVDLVGMAVVNLSNTDSLVIGGSTNNVPVFSGASAALVIPPGGWNLWYGGPGGVQPVQTTGDIIRLAAVANTPQCRFGFAGRSA